MCHRCWQRKHASIFYRLIILHCAETLSTSFTKWVTHFIDTAVNHKPRKRKCIYCVALRNTFYLLQITCKPVRIFMIKLQTNTFLGGLWHFAPKSWFLWTTWTSCSVNQHRQDQVMKSSGINTSSVDTVLPTIGCLFHTRIINLVSKWSGHISLEENLTGVIKNLLFCLWFILMIIDDNINIKYDTNS